MNLALQEREFKHRILKAIRNLQSKMGLLVTKEEKTGRHVPGTSKNQVDGPNIPAQKKYRPLTL